MISARTPRPSERLGERKRQPGLAGGGRPAERRRAAGAGWAHGRRAGSARAVSRAAAERVRARRARRAHRPSPPTQCPRTAQVHELVLAVRPVRCSTPSARRAKRPSSDQRRRLGVVVVLVAARRNDRVDEHLGRPPEPRPVAARGRSASWTASRSFRRRRFSAGRHVVGEARRRRPGPRRVRRRKHLVVAHGLEQPERRLELRLGFAAEADDDVGRSGDAGHRRRGSAPSRSR